MAGKTLSREVWRAFSTGVFNRAAKVCVVLPAISACSSVLRAAADDVKLAVELDALDALVADVRDATADFTERKFTPLLKKPLTSRGQVRIKGDKMLWETRAPHPSVMLMERDTIRIYYPKRATMEVYRLSEKLGFVTVSPLPRRDALVEHFHIDRPPTGSIDRTYAASTHLALRLRPKSEFMSDYLEYVDVVLDRKTAFAVQVVMVDMDGDRTVIEFSDPKTNVGLSDDDVALVVPERTKIVHPLEGDRGASAPAGARDNP